MSGEVVAAWAGVILSLVISFVSIRQSKDSDRRSLGLASELASSSSQLSERIAARSEELSQRITAIAREDHANDILLDLQKQASQVSAWIAVAQLDVDGTKELGDNWIIIKNATMASVCDFKASVVINGVDFECKVPQFPPGEFAVRYNHRKQLTNYTFDFPKYADSALKDGFYFQPYMSTPKYKVLEIQFVDGLGNHWKLVQGQGVTLVKPSGHPHLRELP